MAQFTPGYTYKVSHHFMLIIPKVKKKKKKKFIYLFIYFFLQKDAELGKELPL